MPITSIYSLQTNITCIILLIIIKYQMKKRTASYSSAEMLFNMCNTIIMVLCIADMGYAVMDGRFFPGVRILLEVSNMVYFESITLVSFVWMIYVLVRLGDIDDLRDKKLILWAAPLIVFTVILISNHWNHFLFYFDAYNEYKRGSYIFIHWILSWPYLLLITGILFYRVYIEQNRIKMSESKILLSFIIAPFISNILQMLSGGMSISQVGMTISVMVVYVATLNRQIRRDELTGLNNNRAFRSFISDTVFRENFEGTLMIMMLDIDDFKSINDNYGHIEGDRALIYVSDVLKIVCGRCNKDPFLCRYAGDEFVIAGFDFSQDDIDLLQSSIAEELDRMNNDNNTPYILSLSCGHASMDCNSNSDIEKLISQADMNMYSDKKNKKAK